MTIKLKKFTTHFGSERVKCPFCTFDTFTKFKDPISGIHRHIASQSRNEALDKLLGAEKKTPHLDYFMAHTSPTQVVKIAKRGFDDDLTLDD